MKETNSLLSEEALLLQNADSPLPPCGVGIAARSDDAFDVGRQVTGVLPPIDEPAPLALLQGADWYGEGSTP